VKSSRGRFITVVIATVATVTCGENSSPTAQTVTSLTPEVDVVVADRTPAFLSAEEVLPLLERRSVVAGATEVLGAVPFAKDFADGLSEALRAADLRVSRVYVEHRGANRDVYQIKALRHEDTLALCRWMYDAVPEGQRLNRKYERFRKAVDVGAQTTGAAGGGGTVGSSRARDTAEPGRAARGRPSAPKR